MMHQLTGEFQCKVDTKGRLKLPSGLLKQLDGMVQNFTINRGYEKHLMLYPRDVWAKKTNEINQLNININRNRKAVRYFYRGASLVDCDGSDRILIPKVLLEYAGIDREVVVFAYHEQIEIWDKNQYYSLLDEEPEDFSDLAEEVFGGNDKIDE